ncbi:MAG: ATP-binding protein [Promethearchaeota archaeon]
MSRNRLTQDQNDAADHKIYKLSEEQTQLLDNIEAQVWYIIKPEICGIVNQARADFFGKNKDYFQGKSLYDFLLKEEAKIAIEENKEVFLTKKKIFTEQWIKNKSKEPRLLSIVKMPKLDKNGNVEYIICLGQDLTGQKKTETKYIQHQEEYADKILNITNDEIILIDLEGTILEINRKGILASEKEYNQLIGTKIESIMPIDLVDYIYLQKDDLIKNKKTIVFDFERSGVFLEISIYPIINNEGKVEQLAIIAHDITIRKLTETLLVETKDRYKKNLEQEKFYKDLFTHDIYNVFNVISMSSELLLKKEVKLEEIIGLIKRSIERGTKLIDNIRKLSQLDFKDFGIEKIEVKSILKDVVNFTINSNIKEQEVKIDINSPEKDYFVRANKLLYDVFENLLTNAIKYNNEEIVQINIDVLKVTEKNIKYVKIEIKDNGLGISDEQKQNIFAGINNQDNTKGMGIGLSLVKKIIDNYNGKIWVEDRIKEDPSRGSNFILLIPEFY